MSIHMIHRNHRNATALPRFHSVSSPHKDLSLVTGQTKKNRPRGASTLAISLLLFCFCLSFENGCFGVLNSKEAKSTFSDLLPLKCLSSTGLSSYSTELDLQIASKHRKVSPPPSTYVDGWPLNRRCSEQTRTASDFTTDEVQILRTCLLEECKEPQTVFELLNKVTEVSLNRNISCLIVGVACGSDQHVSNLTNNPETGTVHTESHWRIPSASQDLFRNHKNCAVVGNGPGLLKPGIAEAIARHDAVYRFNVLQLGPREGELSLDFDGASSYSFTKRYRIFNLLRTRTAVKSNLKRSQNETWLFWNYGSAEYVDYFLRENPDTYFLSIPFIEHMLDTYFLLRAFILSLGVGKFMCPKNLPSGLHALFLALCQCDKVNLFGFSHNTGMLTREDTISPRMAPTHAWDFDVLLIRLLFLSRRVDICTT